LTCNRKGGRQPLFLELAGVGIHQSHLLKLGNGNLLL
jgi:hypothetical protein